MIIKTTFKSHFKIKKTYKNINKNIFVKNITILLLFSKIFLHNCKTTILFNKNKKLQTSFLKAPSRHKKFFHQVVFETFSIKLFFFYDLIKISFDEKTNFSEIFLDLKSIFSAIGSNILTKTKFSTSFKFSFKINI